MKRVVLVLAMLAFGGLVAAQTKPDNQLSPTVRLYEPKVVDGAAQLAFFVTSVVKGASVRWEPAVHALVIRGDNPADLDLAEALLKRFDGPERRSAPTPQVELTTYLIRAWPGATLLQAGAKPPLSAERTRSLTLP